METALYLVMNVLRVYSVYLLVNVFIEKKEINNRLIVMAYAAFYAVNSLFYLVYNSTVINIATNVIPIFLITFLYKSKIGKRIFVTVLVYAISMLVESVVFITFNALNINRIIINSGFASDIIMFFIAVFIQSIVKGKFKTFSSVKAIYYIVIVFLPIGSIAIGHFAMRDRGLKTLVVASILLLIDFLVFYFFNEISDSYKYKYEASLLQMQNEIQLANYNEISKNYQESQKLIHDIKKHLYTLSQLSSINKEKADNYRKIIEKSMDSLIIGFHCTNQILSIVMSQKISVAESEGIRVETNVEDLSLDFVEDLDITAIFANLWDNAIEACKCISQKDRFIRVIMAKKNNMVVICFENSFNGIVNKKNNMVISSKNSKSGIGFSILSTVAQKYDGLLFTEHSMNVFKTELTLNSVN